ncbi:hypothetical protein C2845_PM08G10590 [Panicum miliaceum]|uniref:Uncharacterized protein n=1 Tax=Panicum miliaceum TaxID=4540 RepID=A0A3L6R055_PANMI|nr:hypothetical protein C2845_PM08G10590 [Panicum miliaceum]
MTPPTPEGAAAIADSKIAGKGLASQPKPLHAPSPTTPGPLPWQTTRLGAAAVPPCRAIVPPHVPPPCLRIRCHCTPHTDLQPCRRTRATSRTTVDTFSHTPTAAAAPPCVEPPPSPPPSGLFAARTSTCALPTAVQPLGVR